MFAPFERGPNLCGLERDGRGGGSKENMYRHRCCRSMLILSKWRPPNRRKITENHSSELATAGRTICHGIIQYASILLPLSYQC